MKGVDERILREPATIDRLENSGASPAPTTAADAQAFIATEAARWGTLIRDVGIKAE